MNTINLICDACGIDFPRAVSEVNRNKKAGRATYCSRKCASKNSISNIPVEKRGLTNHLPKGKVRDEFSDFRYYLRKANSRDGFFGRETNLSLQYLKQLWQKQEGRCAYTAIPMTLKTKQRTPYDASLDRIDSSKGYMVGNVQFVCQLINLAKSDFSDEQMKAFISQINMPM